MCSNGCSFIYRYWGVFWSNWESDVLCGPFQSIEEAFVNDFGSCGEVEYEVTVKTLKASVIAKLIRILAPPGHKVKINGECWVVGTEEKLMRCDKCFPGGHNMLGTVEENVEAIAAGVAEGHIGRSTPWGGADVAIVSRLPELTDTPDFYPPPRFVVTRFARELSWLFKSLQIAFAGALDYETKYSFYGRLADAADRYTADGPVDTQTREGLISAVLREARLLTGDFGDRLPVAIETDESP